MTGKTFALTAAALFAGFAFAEFAEPPKAAVKALKITRGKQFKSGLVFIDGKYIPPPYQIERYGVVLRVNGIQATTPVVPWEEFLKTQEGVKISKTEQPVPTDAPAPEPEVEDPLASDSDDDPLADLFDDEPSAKKPAAKRSAPRPRVRTPKVTTTYTLEGDFVPNDASKALVAKINKDRTDVDSILRKGGYICFGSAYSRITGDAFAAKMLLEKMPGLMKSSHDVRSFAAGVRSAGFVYFSEALCRDLFRNKVDYIRLQERLRAVKEEERMNALINGRSY